GARAIKLISFVVVVDRYGSHLDEINCEQKWVNEGGRSAPSLKTRTAVLLQEDFTFHSFGERALLHYIDLPVSERSRYYFFDKFKMCLYGEVSSRPIIQAANGKRVEAIIVFSAALAFLKRHILARMKEG